MIHLYFGTHPWPVCGPVPQRGEAVLEFYFRDLCPACRTWQARRNEAVRRRLAAMKATDDE